MSKIVGMGLYLPEKRSDKAYLRTLTCRLEGECPALAEGWCIHNASFGGGCVYGKWTRTDGFTKRAKSYYKWVTEARAKKKDYPLPGSVRVQMAFVGDYVWLPYAHIANEGSGVAFVGHSGALRFFALPFIKVEDFTPKSIVRLVKFRPMALFGGEIITYQKESLPLFLYHLKRMRHDLYDAACELYPEIITKTLQPESFRTRPVEFRNIPPGTRVQCKRFKGIWDGHVVSMRGGFELLPLVLQLGMMGATDVKVEFTPGPGDAACVLDDDVLATMWEEGKLV